MKFWGHLVSTLCSSYNVHPCHMISLAYHTTSRQERRTGVFSAMGRQRCWDWFTEIMVGEKRPNYKLWLESGRFLNLGVIVENISASLKHCAVVQCTYSHVPASLYSIIAHSLRLKFLLSLQGINLWLSKNIATHITWMCSSIRMSALEYSTNPSLCQHM